MSLRANASGYLPGGYGQDVAWGNPGFLNLSDKEWARDLAIRLLKAGTISGQILDEENEPVSGILVRTIGRVVVAGEEHLAAGPVAVADERGRYQVTDLFPGRYVVAVPAALPQDDGQGGATLSSEPATVSAGGRTISIPSAPGSRNLAGRLMPLPRASLEASSVRYPVTFSPGGDSLIGALVVQIEAGGEALNVDIHLVPRTTRSISGRVTGGSPGMLRLIASDIAELGLGFEIASVPITEGGQFVFRQIPAGRYVIQAGTVSEYRVGTIDSSLALASLPASIRRSNSSIKPVTVAPSGTYLSTTSFPGVSGEWGHVSVNVDTEDLIDVSVPLNSCTTVEGRIALEQRSPKRPASIPRLSIVAEPATSIADASPVQAPIVDAPGRLSFVMPCVRPGRYVIRSSSAAWQVRSVNRSGLEAMGGVVDVPADRADSELTVTLTDAGVTLTGEVRAGDHLVNSGVALIFPTEPALWKGFGLSPSRINLANIDAGGRYLFASLPAGEYFLLALEDPPPAGWQRADFFRTASPFATRLRVEWGEVRNQNLPLSSLR